MTDFEKTLSSVLTHDPITPVDTAQTLRQVREGARRRRQHRRAGWAVGAVVAMASTGAVVVNMGSSAPVQEPPMAAAAAHDFDSVPWPAHIDDIALTDDGAIALSSTPPKDRRHPGSIAVQRFQNGTWHQVGTVSALGRIGTRLLATRDGAHAWVVGETKPGAKTSLLTSTDGGATWAPVKLPVDEPPLGIDQLALSSDSLWIGDAFDTAEQGALLRLDIATARVDKVAVPGLSRPDRVEVVGDVVVAEQLAGDWPTMVSRDNGASWSELAMPCTTYNLEAQEEALLVQCVDTDAESRYRWDPAADRFDPITGIQTVMVSGYTSLGEGRAIIDTERGAWVVRRDGSTTPITEPAFRNGDVFDTVSVPGFDYAFTTDGVLRSTDGGVTWSAAP